MAFLVFMRDGYAVLLEGYTAGGDDTSGVEVGQLTFTLRPSWPLGNR